VQEKLVELTILRYRYVLCKDNDVIALCVPKMNISDKLPLRRPMTRWRNQLEKDIKNRLGDRYNTSAYGGRQKWRFHLKTDAPVKT
jgi:hypothetical protein